jgi:hypothetical protein
MAKATRVYSTPPTNTSAIDHPMMFPPRDSSRRGFLALAAGASVVSVGALTAAAVAASAQDTACEADPIFAAIDAHRQAHAASAAASAETRRLVDLADQTVGHGISVPSMIEPGTTVEASIWLDIEETIPRATYPEQHAHHLALLEEHRAAREAITGDTDLIGEEEYADEWDALGDFADTVPTTLAGLLAMIIYAAECSDKDPDAFTDHSCPLIGNLAIAARTIGRQA